jgi:integrase
LSQGNVTTHPLKENRVTINTPRGRKDPPRIFTIDECKRLLEAARTKYPNLIPYVALALFCGVRPDKDSEMGRITPADIHLDAGVLEIPDGASKCGPGRTVRLVHTVKQIETKNGEQIDRSVHFEPARAWLRLAPKLEIVHGRYWRNKLCKEAKVKWSPDVTRHTFASYHYFGFKNGTDTSEQMGHNQSLAMLKRHYLQRVTDEACAEFWKLLPPPIVKVMENVA